MRDLMQNPFLCRQILSLAVKQFEETGTVSLSFRNTAVLMVEVLMSNIKFNSKYQVTDFTNLKKEEGRLLKKVFKACFGCIADGTGDLIINGFVKTNNEDEDVFVDEGCDDDEEGN